jgi:senataxin
MTVDFDSVVIDEAAQCIELSALIPLKYGCAKCIMVGDPKQLPPTVLSREAARFQYEQSLFVRMQRNKPDDVHLLDTQYRMHPAISRFPSRVFYDDRLLDGPDMAALRTQAWHKDPLLGPYRFYDVAGRSENAPRGHSLINVAEVDAALALYRRLIQSVKGYDFTGKIGIITPYKSQLRLLSDRFANVHGASITKTIEFNTTDAFQGRESEIIIFSCVRASDRGIGFLADIRRMNVGITRAKSSLWVLGNSKALIQGEFWGKLVGDAKDRGLFEQGNVMKTLRERPKVVTDAKAAIKTGDRGKGPKPSPPGTGSPLPSPDVPLKPTLLSRPQSVSSATTSSLNSGDSSSDDGKESTEPGTVPGKATHPSKVISSPEEDIMMPDAPSLDTHSAKQRVYEPNNALPGTNTPKRKRSDSPQESASLGLKAEGVKDEAKSAEAVRNDDKPGVYPPKAPRPNPAAPPPPRPRKPAGDDAMFIKPRRKK